MEKEKGRSKGRLSNIKAFIIAPLIFLVILGGLFAYSGVWPPLVVVESNSMQHDAGKGATYDSHIGNIDTGDIVIVKKVSSQSDIQTYVDGLRTGHQTYGEYGDVVIYSHQGMDKPIIHRAIVYLEYNATGGGYDVPSLQYIPDSEWSSPGGGHVWWNLSGYVELYHVGYQNATVHIDLSSLLSYAKANGRLHSGLITMGDNNWAIKGNRTVYGLYDQDPLAGSQHEPISFSWVIGTARGELPWFGVLKLWVTGSAPSYTPPNSQTDLLISIGLIVGIPIALDVSNSMLKKRGIEMFAFTKRFRWKKGDAEKESEKATSTKGKKKEKK